MDRRPALAAERRRDRSVTAPDEKAEAAALCRRLVRAAGTAALATAEKDRDAWPYASLVLVATDHAARPLLLLSDLADHTKNLAQDGRVSLLFDGTAGLADPLAGARAALQGRARKLETDAEVAPARRRFLARHAGAEGYADFGDFSFYRVAPERFHLVAGFGRIHRIDANTVLFDTAGTEVLAEREQDIVEHMNEDHADAIDLYAEKAAPGAGAGWRMIGIDPEGADLSRDGRFLRIPFAKIAADSQTARVELVRLAKQARGQGST